MTQLRIVDAAVLDELVERARASDRGRMNLNLHAAMEDPVHRLLNATEPRTYVQPHRHLTPPKHETLSVLRGRGAVVRFDDSGEVAEIVVLAPSGPVSALEIPPDGWHTLLALDPGTVWLEAKAGPYVPPPGADRASWAPEPDDADAAEAYLARLRAQVAAAPSAIPRGT